MNSQTDFIVQNAQLQDVPDIVELLNRYSDIGILLPRTKTDIYHSLSNFWTIRKDSRLAACASLMIYNHELAEVRSLAVHPDYQQHGLGKQLVRHLENRAVELGLSKLVALTYVVKFFEGLGFKTVDMAQLPEKLWNVCVYCRKFNNCDEIAMLKYL